MARRRRIKVESAVRMALEPGSWTLGRRRFMDRSVDDFRFRLTEGEQGNPPRLQDCRDAHGQGPCGDLGELTEENRIVSPGDFIEADPTSPAVGRRGWLVETDVPCSPDPQNLKIQTARRPDGSLIGDAGARNIARCAVGNLNIRSGDIDMLEEIFFHEMPIRSRVGWA